MGKYRCKGAMTIFFSVITVVMLSLVCSLAESARIQGARAKAAAVLDMGIFSVFGGYERALLEEYDVFGVEAGLGNAGDLAGNLEDQLKEYMGYNTKKEWLSIISGSSLFPMELNDAQITEYLLLTDEKGTVFRDQVVQNWKSAFGTEILGDYLEAREKGEELLEAGERYESQEVQANAKLAEAEAAEQDVVYPDQEVVSTVENPLDLIEQIKKSGILGLVMKNPAEVSQKAIKKSEFPSGRSLEKGTMKWEHSKDGLLEEGIFQLYLFDHFSCVLDEREDGVLDYELEYLLGGKESDMENLKATVHKLLLMREGVNALYVLSNTGMRQSAEAMAALISGGVPGVTAALAAALLLAWAYGESLLDVRILLSGGKVPVVKTAESFRLTLENLGRLPEILVECDEVKGEGLGYRAYLQMLFLTGKKSEYPMRALDLIEGNLRQQEGMEHFQVDHCAAGMAAEASWKLNAVFSKIPEAFLGEGLGSIFYKVRGNFAYSISEG